MRIVYRPEIDGLRTVAVFAVIIYHSHFILLGHPLFQGGFIGVDIFFVISGYLITTLILKEIIKTNQFSFKYFYERRIRRVLPTLLFVTIITSIISYFILLPSSLVDFGKSVLSIIFFISNFYFWLAGGKYGEESELLKPLLHTWSLSVEEQFYILFPIFLIIVTKFFRKYLFRVLFLSFWISLLFSEYFLKTHPSLNFYIILSRSFECLIGSILSYFYLNNGEGGRKSYSILNQICPSLGIVLILYSFLFFNFTKIFHPSVITLIPLIGVSLIIWFSKKRGLITEILSSKIFVFFGLISYSLYLWHYPIFAFLRYIDLFHHWVKLLAIVLTIALSILSYYLIERPFRNKNIISIKTLTTCILISVIILLSYSFYALKTEGIKNRFPSIISKILVKEKNYDQIKINEENQNIVLIGDSHADSLEYYLKYELKKKNYNLYRFRTSLYLQQFNLINKNQKIIENNLNNKDHLEINKNFLETNENIESFLLKNKNQIVILHYKWAAKFLGTILVNNEEIDSNTYYEPFNILSLTNDKMEGYLANGILSTINSIIENGHSLIIVYSVPELGFDVQKKMNKIIIYNKIMKHNQNVPILTVDYSLYKKRNEKIFKILDSIQGPDVYRVYPEKFFCNTKIQKKCIANDNENLYYYDSSHLSLEGSKYLVNDIMETIRKVEVNNIMKTIRQAEVNIKN